MKQMNLYFNGCSLVYGDDLPEDTRSSVVWPALIAKHYNATFFNDAVSGGSNDRIITNILQNDKKYDKYYISWTMADRFTLYDPSNWFEINFQRRLGNDKYKNKDYYLTFGKYYYAYWTNIIFDFKKWLGQIILLQKYFVNNRLPYLMVSGHDNFYSQLTAPTERFIESVSTLINIDNFNDDQLYTQHKEINILLDQIDFDNFITPNFFHWEHVRKNITIGPTGHPLEDGHAIFAKFILNFESQGYKTNLQEILVPSK